MNALALNNDGSVLYSGAGDRSILVWEKDSVGGGNMVVVGALRGHTKAILCLVVVADLVFSGSVDKSVRVWRRGVEKKSPEGEVVDDLFSAYMNLDNIDALNSSGTDDKNGIENRDDLDSRASGTETNGGDSSDNEAESSVNESGGSMQRQGMNSSGEKKEGIKRSVGGDIAPTTRHYRSVSMDSFIGKLNFNENSPKLPPSPGIRPGQLSPSNSIDGHSAAFSLEFGNGEFSGPGLKKIMANEKPPHCLHS